MYITIVIRSRKYPNGVSDLKKKKDTVFVA